MIRSIAVALIALSVWSRPGALTGNDNPVREFWQWFKKNEVRLRHFQANPDKYLGEILTGIRKVRPGLVVELEPPKNGVINMTISADGDRNLFPEVENLVKQAPHLPGWRMIAFRQRLPSAKVKTMVLKTADFIMDPGKMKFYPVIEGDSVDIIVYTPGVTPENYERIGYAGLLLMDNLLGEYDCVTKVRSYDFHDMPAEKEALDSLKPLLDIAKWVDHFHTALTPK